MSSISLLERLNAENFLWLRLESVTEREICRVRVLDSFFLIGPCGKQKKGSTYRFLELRENPERKSKRSRDPSPKMARN